MYPASVQIFLSQFPLGKKTVMMASRELTASSAQPPEHNTALVCKHNTIQTLSVVRGIICASLPCNMATLLLLFQCYYRVSLVWETQPGLQWKLKMAENFIGALFFFCFSFRLAQGLEHCGWTQSPIAQTRPPCCLEKIPIISALAPLLQISSYPDLLSPLVRVLPDAVLMSIYFIRVSCFYGDAYDGICAVGPRAGVHLCCSV